MALRSAEELEGWAIVATDGEIGNVYEFYFDDESWTIRYLVADVGSWLTGRRVLISPAAVSSIAASEKQIHVKLNKEQVRNSPDVDTDKPFDRQQEIAYLTYYGWPSYWG
ncbi:MAG TPA: PRC-barrel domain-containing protein, partial [Candidatus Binatia bacterium]